jgi:hypothetical protein
MNQGKTVFSQLMSFLSAYEFDKCVNRYMGNYNTRKFSCRDQFYVMCFAQLTYRDSLRDIETCLRALSNKLYHSGIRCAVSKSALAKANELRNSSIYFDFAQTLILEARTLYEKSDPLINEINLMCYALDSTTIDLCLNLYSWANFRKTKGAIKLHTLLDLRGSIPVFISITNGSIHDVNVLDYMAFEPNSLYVMDLGYVDYERLFKINLKDAYFITRAKVNMKSKRLYSKSIDKTIGLKYDQTIKLTGKNSIKNYPDKLRRIKFKDDISGKTYIFITNNFELEAFQITQLYKKRWDIELFFKWIKQNLKIKSFYGYSENAVITQVWIAISTYLLVVIAKKKLNLDQSPYTLLQTFSLCLFEKTPINELFTNSDYKAPKDGESNQLEMF